MITQLKVFETGLILFLYETPSLRETGPDANNFYLVSFLLKSYETEVPEQKDSRPDRRHPSFSFSRKDPMARINTVFNLETKVTY